MIKPTVGRIVWFQPSSTDLPSERLVQIGKEPLAAIVVAVHSDTCINLAVFDANGCHHARTSVPLIQGDDPVPESYYCEWMPYQIAQAEKAEVVIPEPATTSTGAPGVTE
jgi:hypothetical protein